jgi:cytochrome c-type biogenesis protein CcsB
MSALIGWAYGLLWVAAFVYVGRMVNVRGRMVNVRMHVAVDRRRTGRLATGTAVGAWMALTGGLVARGVEAGHWPLTNQYEFALCFAWTILMVYLLLESSWRERRAGPFVLAVALLVATYALTRPADEKAVAPLLPALRSVWLQVHVLTIAVGYGAFGVAAGLGLTLGVADSKLRRAGLQSRLPPVEEIEHALERAIGLGFPWLTLGILTGAIWAQNAWGRYWGWDPKETWALVTWLFYLLILHVRPLRRWRGRRRAALAVVGFGVVLFTFAGVPWLVRIVRLESLHGF